MRRYLYLVGLFLIPLYLTSCISSCKKDLQALNSATQVTDTSADFRVQYNSHVGWTYNQNIYEVNIRQYTSAGTFKAFEEHLPRLSDMGVGILWIMPVHPIGIENRNAPLGSYYSAKDYSEVNPEFGTMSDFKDLVKAAHDKGMYVIIDWVANHTSWDNTLTKTNPDFYLLTKEGKFQAPPGHEEWSDVIQLDYTKPELHTYMIGMLKKWVIETGIDGFRFDYVDGVPVEFWKKANSELKALKPDIFLVAEGDGIKYHEMGFDMDYCWSLQGWDRGVMRQIFEGKKNVYDLDSFLNTEKSNYIPELYHMYFTSNHDENSWHGSEFEQLGASAEVFAVLTQTLYGMPLVYSGQEAGLNRRLEFFKKDEIYWDKLPYENIYRQLNHLRDTCPALWNGNTGGTPIRVNTTADGSVFAFNRTKNNSKVLVFLNLTSKSCNFKIANTEYNGNYYDIFSEQQVSVSNQTAFTLNAWDYLVLVKK